MKQINGWWLPDGDKYFEPFTKDGFQLDHLEAALKHVRSWTFALDIGSHIGMWAKVLAGRFDSVLAFEAANDTFECLSENITEPNVVKYHVAVGDRAGHAAMQDDAKRPGNTGARFVRPNSEVTNPDGDLLMLAIDELGMKNVGFIKLDVEGYELQALRGARETIQRSWPTIIMETDKKFARIRYGVPDDAAERFLLGMDYRVVEHIRPDKVFAHV